MQVKDTSPLKCMQAGRSTVDAWIWHRHHQVWLARFIPDPCGFLRNRPHFFTVTISGHGLAFRRPLASVGSCTGSVLLPPFPIGGRKSHTNPLEILQMSECPFKNTRSGLGLMSAICNKNRQLRSIRSRWGCGWEGNGAARSDGSAKPPSQ